MRGKPAAEPNERWVESTLKRLTLREKIGQLLMVYVYGEFTSTQSPAFKDLLDQVNENHIGGFILGTQTDPLGIAGPRFIQRQRC